MNAVYVVSPELYQRCMQMCLSQEWITGSTRADGHVWILQFQPHFAQVGFGCQGFKLSDVLLRVIEQTKMKGV